MSGTRQVYLIRHGESTGNRDNRWQGAADFPLSPRGIWEAERVAAALAGAGLVAIVTSPLGRAAETAGILGRRLGLSPVSDPRLHEYDLGELAGLRVDDIKATYPAVYEAMVRPGTHYVPMPGEEGARPFRRRVTAAWTDLLELVPDGPIAVVTHRAVLMSLLNHFIGFPPERRSPFRFHNGSISSLVAGRGRTRIRSLNDTCHLRV